MYIYIYIHIYTHTKRRIFTSAALGTLEMSRSFPHFCRKTVDTDH